MHICKEVLICRLVIEFLSCETCFGFDGSRTEGDFVLHFQLDLHHTLGSDPPPASALLMGVV